MVKIGVHDLLKYEILERGDHTSPLSPQIDIRSVSGEECAVIRDLPAEENLIVRAAITYFQSQGACAHILLDVEKNIPAGAGLGGGSADAAGMIRILMREFSAGEEGAMLELARKLGADIPFCMQDRPALCEGIGDVVTPLEGRIDLPMVLVNCGIHVNTRHAYVLLGRTENRREDDDYLGKKKMAIKDFVRTGDISIARKEFVNDFEKAAFSMHPGLEEVKTDLYSSGASFAIMTGSGSSMVGLYENESTAEDAALRLSGKYTFVCNTRIL